jgi:hypothetical protein
LSGRPEPERYTGAEIAGAVLATLFFPLIGLVAALILLNGQSNPAKRKSLRSWAWVSAGLMVLDALVVAVLVGAI